jgi:hypothetical protein
LSSSNDEADEEVAVVTVQSSSKLLVHPTWDSTQKSSPLSPMNTNGDEDDPPSLSHDTYTHSSYGIEGP